MKHLFTVATRLGRTAGLLLGLALAGPATYAQAPAWQSAFSLNGSESGIEYSVADSNGNLYVTGRAFGTVTFGTIPFTGASGSNGFVAKWSAASGTFVWVQPLPDRGRYLAVQGNNVYVTGAFSGYTAVLGNTTLTNADITGASYDVYLAKLVDAGSSVSVAWAQQVGSIGDESQPAVAVSGSSVYLTATFASPSVTLGSTTLGNAGPGGSLITTDVLVAKLTDAGSSASYAWALSVGGGRNEHAAGIAASGNHVYLAGAYVSRAVDFGSTTLTSSYPNGDVPYGYLSRLTDNGPSGSFDWATNVGGHFTLAGLPVVHGGAIYLLGTMTGLTATFGSTLLVNADASIATTDMFVVRYADGPTVPAASWAQRFGGLGFEYPGGLAVQGTSVFVAGSFRSARLPVGTTTLVNLDPSGATEDIFLTKLTDNASSASISWVAQANGSDSELPSSVAVVGSRVCITGTSASASTAFGPLRITNSAAAFGNNNAFLATLTDPTLTATVAPSGPARSLSLYPNPARGSVTLRLSAPEPLHLTDALGRPVRHYPAPTTPETTLDLHGLPTGLYLLHAGPGAAHKLLVE